MEFEELQDTAAHQTLVARSLVLQFWTALQDRSPDLSRLTAVGDRVNAALADAQATYGHLLEMAPQSAPVMRAYAGFLLELANDPRRAAELLSDADQIEDEGSHTKAAELDPILGAVVPEFDLTGESVAIVTVSAQPATAGLITDANTAAARMFGYNRREMLGKDANVIIPEPIASVHSQYLDDFLTDGKEVIGA